MLSDAIAMPLEAWFVGHEWHSVDTGDSPTIKFVHICIYMYTHTCTCTQYIHINVYVYVCINTHVLIYVSLQIHMSLYSYTCLYKLYNHIEYLYFKCCVINIHTQNYTSYIVYKHLCPIFSFSHERSENMLRKIRKMLVHMYCIMTEIINI